MRNASQQLAQCGQLFGLMQAFLRLAQLVAGIVQIGDVGRHAADPVDLAICVAQREDRVEDHHVAPACLVVVFARHRQPGRQKLVLRLPRNFGPLAGVKGLGGQMRQVRLGQAIEVQRPLVGHQILAIQAAHSTAKVRTTLMPRMTRCRKIAPCA